jgi:hypothetical protein
VLRYRQSAVQPSRRQRKTASGWTRSGYRAIGATSARTTSKTADPKAKTRTTSSTALEHGDLMAQRDRFQRQRGEGLGFAASGRWGGASLVGIRTNPGYNETFEITNEFIRIKF